MLETLIWFVPAAVACLGALRPRAGLLVLAASLPLFGSPPGGPYLTAFDSTLLRLSQALPDVETWSALYTWRAAADLILGWGLVMAVRRAFSGRSPTALARAVLIGLGGATVAGLASQVGLVDLSGFRPSYGPRLASFFFNSGWFAASPLVMATPLAVAALVVTDGWRHRLAVPVAALAVACLALTHQRGAWVAALLQVLFLGVALAIRSHRNGNGAQKPLRQAPWS